MDPIKRTNRIGWQPHATLFHIRGAISDSSRCGGSIAVIKSLKVVPTLIIVALFVGIAIAQRASVPHAVRPLNKLAVALDEVKQLLLLMEADKNGKISKQDFMRFVEAEFDRLDKDRSGELDLAELRRSQLVASRSGYAGQADRK